ncbi:MAG: formylglycine-generating enzyme family protein [Bacteroidetes bacterium]|nr:formylglycine-generating enzyme family protein [Bacteroidota bacterium]
MSVTKTIALLLLIQSTSGEMQPIIGGSYKPLYGQTKKEFSVEVADFFLDKYPVTNEQFLLFVKANPSWQKSKVKSVFADKAYLRNWQGDLTPGENSPLNSPVTNVSWFAARAYAKWLNKRLPTTDEWEYVGRANATKKDATLDSTFYQYLLDWYEKPVYYPLPAVGQTFKNVYGIFDMHGLVWEWTDDFNSIMLSGESRKDKGEDKNLFCSGGAVGAKDLTNYAGFMRYAFRSSLKGNYCLNNLGFRCARNYHENEK